MTKVKKLVLFVILLLMATVICLSFNSKISKAETVREDTAVCGNEEVTPRGIYTKMDFAVDGGNGKVWLTAKNQFTLFPSTVTVTVELYRADTYQEDFANMTLVASNYIYDLDQGETLTATASTDGKQSYWKAKGRYKRDSSDWVEVVFDTVLFNANGYRVV